MSYKCAVRIVNVDFYMSPPVQDLDVMYSEFRGSSVTHVPVIRIFGSTDSGEKICLHVHDVFPYLYIPYDGTEDANSLKYQIAANIDKAVNVSFGQASSTTQHVYKVTLISGVPFYGYHVREHQFFKIFLYNPALIRKVSYMLQSEVILGRLYQPHESHIPYILQFMIDYNLHGMSRILLNDLKFRDDSTNSLPKQSTCQLEADTSCENIINRFEITQGNLGINPGIAALWEDEKQRLRNKGEDSEIGTCLTLKTSQVEPTKTHLIFKQALTEKLCVFEDFLEKNESDQSLSVYPAETPRDYSSFPKVHSSLSSDSFNESLDLNATINEDAKNLFEILQDLGKRNLEEEEEETDSVLSQVQKEEEDENNEENFDLSMSMAETTPFKNIVESLSEDSVDVTFIPQLDGQGDSDDENEDRSKSTKKKSKYDALPIFVSSPAVNGGNQDFPQNVEQIKRKLSFHDVTVVENKVECEYKPQNKEKIFARDSFKRRKIKKSDVQKNTDLNLEQTKEQKLVIDDALADKENAGITAEGIKIQKETLTRQNPKNTEENEFSAQEEPMNSDNIEEFSSAEKPPTFEEENKETIDESKVENKEVTFDEKQEILQNKPTLTAAELYDFQTNYKPKEGCSTKFTQDSTKSTQDSTKSTQDSTKSTQDSNDLKLSSDSSADLFSSNEPPFSQSQESSDCLDPKTAEFPLTPEVIDPNISIGFTREKDSNFYFITPNFKPPTRSEVEESLQKLNIPKVLHQAPFYSDPSDVTGSVELGHSVLKIPSKTTMHLDDWKTTFDGIEAYRKQKIPLNVKWSYENMKKIKLSYCSGNSCLIAPAKRAPTVGEVEQWLKDQTEPKEIKIKKTKVEKVLIPNSPGGCDVSDMELTLTLSPCEDTPNTPQSEIQASPILGKNSKKKKRRENSCQITGRTLDNTYGFKITPENFQEAKAINEYQYITIFCLEIHVETRGDLKPDPEYDSVKGIFYKIFEDGPEQKNACGCIGVDLRVGEVSCELLSVETEEELFNELLKLVQKWDPDILAGYETELLSWGYLLERGHVLGNELLLSLSRIKDKTNRGYLDEGLKVTGRMLLDVWRLLRHEIALQSYSFENIAYHLLHKRIPLFSFKDLTSWWKNPVHRHRTISHYLLRVDGVLQILDQLDLIGRTSELARLFGIQFYEVLSRGSQFRVESMMLRLAKPLNYIPVSPSVQQRAKMKAPEFLPLILEPESKLYVDPVIVLDFQSLYPSMIIAYNYCFSTCLGKVVHLGKNTPFEFGATQLRVSRARVKKLQDKDCLNFSPCGVAFVKKKVRDGILPRMLREILETRLMVKNSMKKCKDDKVLQKVLHNRQLGLKLIANVTYGYTAANFSGRMPAVELADSVVSKGRETLQRAIEMVENTPEWTARVVYGDTDSLFVLIPGKSRAEAFEIGKKIADAVTNANPDPVKLKLEKVYQPCILQTKKRYVGYMYESPDQREPVYDAKGIETVRRDGCPAVAKMLEKCLRLLFETKDVSLVKKYVVRQFHKILTCRVSLQDLTFAKEYRGAAGYRPGACVPALELARKWTAVDRRNEPRRGERVPYVIISGPPGVPLIRLVRSPHEFLSDSSLRPNSIYYITKVVIPPINRCFNLIGADLNGWFNQMPRKHLQYLRNTSPVKKTISQYFITNSCAVCGEQTQKSLCEKCSRRKQNTVVVLHEKVRLWEQAYQNTALICQSCTMMFENNVCISLDCPVLYRVHRTSRDLEQATYVREIINSLGCEPDLIF